MRLLLNNILIYAFIISIISIFCFFLIQNALQIMPFSGNLFFKNFQLWRLTTFPFIHISITHLIQNIVALGIITFLAYEVELPKGLYLGSFLASSIVIALITGIILPTIIIAGLSMGIYAIIGSTSIKGSNFIPKKILIPLFIIAAAIEPISTAFKIETLRSSAFHLLGLGFGLTFIITIRKITPKKRILSLAG